MFWNHRDKLSITPLGGVEGYVGHNCFLYESDSAAIVVDCGIKPEGKAWADPPSRLDILDEAQKKKNVIGIITHAHLDHIGAVREFGIRKIPTYLSAWSKIFMERYEDNLQIPKGAEFYTFDRSQTLRNGDLEISFIPVQHSIPGTYAVLVRSGEKSILHLSDFKMNGMQKSLEESRDIFREIKSKVGRINCLVMDILNTEIEGFTPPEYLVLDSIENIIKRTKGGVFITFFSSNIRRMEGILKIARLQHRVISVAGWGMRSSYEQLTSHAPRRYGKIILIGGSQGEEDSGLARLARGEHQFLQLSRRDIVIYSSRGIPDNEEAISETVENLHEQGATIYLHQGESKRLNLSFEPEEAFLHSSGHEQRGGLREAKEILEPEIIVPFHAPEDRYEIFEKLVGGKETRRLQAGETLKI